MRRALLTFALAVLGLGACARTSSEGGDLRGMTASMHEAYFPITSGAHAGADCNVCHGEFDTFSRYSCIGCHDHERPTTDAAHLGIVAGYAYEAQGCYLCHPHGEAAGFDHEAYFPIGNQTVHQGIRCGACHPDATDRKAIACTVCHTKDQTDPRHLAVAGYLWQSAACYSCHPSSNVPTPQDHDQRFPISVGTTHAGIACAACHVDPANRKVFDCISCHSHEKPATDSNHAGVPDYSYASAECYRCHPQANVTLLADHTGFPIGAGAKHAGLVCSSCHTVPGDKTQFTCTACHSHEQASTALNHTGVPGYSYQSAECYRCHPNAEVVGLIDHTPYFPIETGSTHENTSCSKCHAVPGDRKEISCASCHLRTDMATGHNSVGGYDYLGSLCIRCHADSQVDSVISHLPFLITSGAKHYRKSCLSCHPSFRAEKPWGADFSLPTAACGPCHSQPEMNDKHSNMATYSYSAPSCIQSACHPNGRKPN